MCPFVVAYFLIEAMLNCSLSVFALLTPCPSLPVVVTDDGRLGRFFVCWVLFFAGDSISVSVEAAAVARGACMQGSGSVAFGLIAVAEVLRRCGCWFRCGCGRWTCARRCGLSSRWRGVAVYVIVVVIGIGDWLGFTRRLLRFG